MEQRAASVFDTCLEQALQEAEPLMAAMGNAALAALRAKLLDPANNHLEPLLKDAIEQLKSRRGNLQSNYAQRLRQAAFLIADGKRADYQQLVGGDGVGGSGALESEVLRAQIEWGRVQIDLLQQTEQSLAALERVYRPLRKITRYWRNGNPLHHTVYLDSLQATLQDQRVSIDVTALFLSDMVGVMAQHLQVSYQRITSLAVNSYAELLAKAEAKRQAARDSAHSFARRAKGLFHIPPHCPVGAVRAYKALIPALERLSARDPSFWNEAEHPARLLVQTVVDQATALRESGSTVANPQFPGLVSDTVQMLTALKSPTAEDFAQALGRFGVQAKPRGGADWHDSQQSGYSSSMLAESQWGASALLSVNPDSELMELPEPEPLPRTAVAEPMAPDLELQAALAQAPAPAPALQPAPAVAGLALEPGSLDAMEQDVMALIATHPHSIDADPAVLAALSGAWPQVLHLAAQRSGLDSSSFRDYRQVVSEVLALAGASSGVGVHSEADVLIPSLLTRLKSGLTGIGWMPERIAPVLTAVARMAPSAIVELQAVQEEEVAPAQAEGPLDSTLVLSAAVAQPTRSVTDPADKAFRLCGQALQAGMQFAFLSQGEWVTKQLSWSNPQATMFLFTAGDGASQSITRRMLEKLEVEQAVRPA